MFEYIYRRNDSKWFHDGLPHLIFFRDIKKSNKLYVLSRFPVVTICEFIFAWLSIFYESTWKLRRWKVRKIVVKRALHAVTSCGIWLGNKIEFSSTTIRHRGIHILLGEHLTLTLLLSFHGRILQFNATPVNSTQYFQRINLRTESIKSPWKYDVPLLLSSSCFVFRDFLYS